MSEEAVRRFEEARRKLLERTLCVWCSKPAGEHTTEELQAHLDLDKEAHNRGN
jgi:hypothetical protein